MSSQKKFRVDGLSIPQRLNSLHRRTKFGGGVYGKPEIQKRVQRMSNWQRGRWNAANRPTDLAKLDEILKLERPTWL